MEKGQVNYLVGVGGWEHDVFDECLYPHAGLTAAQKLSYYAGFFETVEIRPTFWDETLKAEDAKPWVDAVAHARTFLFNVKLHGLFTHKRTVDRAVAKNTTGILRHLQDRQRLGALLMQFPYEFTNTSSNRIHLARLAEIFRGFPVHVELRHDSWRTPSLKNFLAENFLSPVNADMPRVKHLMPFSPNTPGETAYLRLHGRNEKGWLLGNYEARYDYLYNARELQELRRRLAALAVRCQQVIIICNNTTRGKAVATALQLTGMLRPEKAGMEPLAVPAAAFNAFSVLQDIATPFESQGSLFGAAEYRAAM
ncbi:MAG: hypothetical protein H6Q30_3200 [Bacteroidetes bacterium]|jgi:uncharacterized protein YecE (DUF72 family)|nr:hypothetical protein [Bacteroidota bacterium]